MLLYMIGGGACSPQLLAFHTCLLSALACFPHLLAFRTCLLSALACFPQLLVSSRCWTEHAKTQHGRGRGPIFGSFVAATSCSLTRMQSKYLDIHLAAARRVLTDTMVPPILVPLVDSGL